MLRVVTKTWTRDSHDLYDYEAQQVNKRSFLISTSVRFFRNRACIVCVEDSSDESPENRQDLLFYVQSYENRGKREYLIFPGDLSMHEMYNIKKLWSIVNKTRLGFHVLQDGDIIKLGRFRLKVRHFALNNNDLSKAQLSDVEPLIMTESIIEGENVQCRICLNEGDSEEDPLICPCDCNGSIKYAHFSCLQKWICGRACIETEVGTGTVFIRDMVCELCKKEFPRSVQKGDRVMHFLKVPDSLFPIMVLDSMNYSNVRGIHILSFAQRNQIRIGRGHECDLRIPDVSISRLHATITYVDGQFRLMDQNSKFGTLVAIRRSVLLNNDTPFVFQVGRSIIEVAISRNEPFVPGIARMVEDITVLDSPQGNNALGDVQEEDPEGTTQTNRVSPNQQVSSNVNLGNGTTNASSGDVIVLDGQDATTFVRRVRRNTATNTPPERDEVTRNGAPENGSNARRTRERALDSASTADYTNRGNNNRPSTENAWNGGIINRPNYDAFLAGNVNGSQIPIEIPDPQNSSNNLAEIIERNTERIRAYLNMVVSQAGNSPVHEVDISTLLEITRTGQNGDVINLIPHGIHRNHRRPNGRSRRNGSGPESADRCLVCEHARSQQGNIMNIEELHASHLEQHAELHRILVIENTHEQARIRLTANQLSNENPSEQNNNSGQNTETERTGGDQNEDFPRSFRNILLRFTRRNQNGVEENRFVMGTTNRIIRNPFSIDSFVFDDIFHRRQEQTEFTRNTRRNGNRRNRNRRNTETETTQENNNQTDTIQESINQTDTIQESNNQTDTTQENNNHTDLIQENNIQTVPIQENNNHTNPIQESNNQTGTVQRITEEEMDEISSEEAIQRNTRRTNVDRTPDAHAERSREGEEERTTERATRSSNVINHNSQGTPATIVPEENVISELPVRKEDSNVTVDTDNMNRTGNQEEEEENNVDVEEEVAEVEEEEGENTEQRREEEHDTSVGIQRTRDETGEMVSENDARGKNRNSNRSNQNHTPEGNRSRQGVRIQVEDRRGDGRDTEKDGSEENSDDESEDNSDDAEEMNKKKNNGDDDDERHNDGTGTNNKQGHRRTSREGIAETGIMNGRRNRENINNRTQNETSRTVGSHEEHEDAQSISSESSNDRIRKRSAALNRVIQALKERNQRARTVSGATPGNKRVPQREETEDDIIMRSINLHYPLSYLAEPSTGTNQNERRGDRSQDRKRKSDDFMERAREHLRRNLARLENNGEFLQRNFGNTDRTIFNENKKFKMSDRNTDNKEEKKPEAPKERVNNNLNNIKNLLKQEKTIDNIGSLAEVKNAFRSLTGNAINETLDCLTHISSALKREIRGFKESSNPGQKFRLCKRCNCLVNKEESAQSEANENGTTNERESGNLSFNQWKRSRSFSLSKDRARFRRDIFGDDASDALRFFARNNNRSLLGNTADLNEEFLKAFGIKRGTRGTTESTPTENNPSLSVVRNSSNVVDSKEERNLSDSSGDSFKSAISRESEVLRGIRQTNNAHADGRTKKGGNGRDHTVPTTDNTPIKINKRKFCNQ